jgi:hypothetical protein
MTEYREVEVDPYQPEWPPRLRWLQGTLAWLGFKRRQLSKLRWRRGETGRSISDDVVVGLPWYEADGRGKRQDWSGIELDPDFWVVDRGPMGNQQLASERSVRRVA